MPREVDFSGRSRANTEHAPLDAHSIDKHATVRCNVVKVHRSWEPEKRSFASGEINSVERIQTTGLTGAEPHFPAAWTSREVPPIRIARGQGPTVSLPVHNVDCEVSKARTFEESDRTVDGRDAWAQNLRGRFIQHPPDRGFQTPFPIDSSNDCEMLTLRVPIGGPTDVQHLPRRADVHRHLREHANLLEQAVLEELGPELQGAFAGVRNAEENPPKAEGTRLRTAISRDVNVVRIGAPSRAIDYRLPVRRKPGVRDPSAPE